MNTDMNLPRAQWSSYSSYVLVTTGAMVGLGNIFHFPFLVAKLGGLFVLFYVLSELFLTIPLLFAELIIGRRGKQNPVGSISLLAMESNASVAWRYVGWLCFIILFLTLSYYTVAVAFPLGYLYDSFYLLFTQGSSSVISDYMHLDSRPIVLEVCFLIFLVATLLVILRGINRGLEGISSITVPTYFILLFLLAIYSCTHGSFIASIYFLFHSIPDQNVWVVLFAALTFAFFKLNVGMGSMIVYGSYLPYHVPLAQSTTMIIILDAIASLLSYFIISPLMLQSNIIAAESNLSYQNIMLIFSSIPHGLIIATIFFFAALIAAWTPTIAMAESAVLTLIERFHISRLRGTLLIGLGAIVVGTIVVLSITQYPSITLFSTWTIDGFIQNLASDLATPLSAFFIAIFCGWIVTRNISFNELGFNAFFYKIWQLILRFLAPICIIIIFLGIGFS